jgi:hypothetical protein
MLIGQLDSLHHDGTPTESHLRSTIPVSWESLNSTEP